MPLTGKQIADAVVASARSSGYFKPYDASPNWQDFYDRVAAKLATETAVSDDFDAISNRILATWPKASQQKLYNALYTAGCRIYKS
jgi:hypothetical protein